MKTVTYGEYTQRRVIMKPPSNIPGYVLISLAHIVTDTIHQTASDRDHVMSAQARAYFEEGRYFQAAQCYAQCSVSFEEVTLKFLDAGERDALRSYLISRLERTRKAVGIHYYVYAGAYT